jgi:hypothetical protein
MNFVEQGLYWEAKSCAQVFKKFPAFHGTRRLITVFTRVRHFFLHRPRHIHFTLTLSLSLRSILTLFSYLRLGIDSGLLLWGVFPKIFMHFLCIIHDPPNSLPSFCNRHEISGEKYEWWRFYLSDFLHTHIISYLIYPNIVFSTLFSNTLNLHYTQYLVRFAIMHNFQTNH